MKNEVAIQIYKYIGGHTLIMSIFLIIYHLITFSSCIEIRQPLDCLLHLLLKLDFATASDPFSTHIINVCPIYNIISKYLYILLISVQNVFGSRNLVVISG